MHQPTKKTLYILIACILSLTAITIAKTQTDKLSGLVALETSSSTPVVNTDQNLEELVTPSNNQTDGSANVTDENLTESFSKSFFAKYYSTNEGAGLTDTDSQALINEAVDAFKTVDLGNSPHYTFQDLKIVKTNEQNLRNFANTFATTEKACLTQVQSVAQSTQDPIQSGNLYKKCAEDFVKIPIVQEINQYYLDLLNTFYLIGEKIYSLEAAKSDPLKALVIIKELGVLDDDRTVIYQNISNLIIKSGIIFSNEEPGKVWVGGVQ